MQEATASVAAKAAATGGLAAVPFGLTWWAVAAALSGVIASLYFERESTPERLLQKLLGVFAFAFVAAMIASASTNAPPILGWQVASVPIEVRAGMCGVCSQWIVRFLRRILGSWAPGV